MLPSYLFTEGAENLLEPDKRTTQSTFIKYEDGGIAISDPSQGLRGWVWQSVYNPLSGDISVKREDQVDQTTIISGELGVIELDFAFDQNMRPVIAWQLPGDIVKYRWYDTRIGNYVVTTLNGYRTPRLTLDYKIPEAISFNISDVLLFVINTTTSFVEVRTQREYYETPVEIVAAPLDSKLKRVGLSRTYRMQIELEP